MTPKIKLRQPSTSASLFVNGFFSVKLTTKAYKVRHINVFVSILPNTPSMKTKDCHNIMLPDKQFITRRLELFRDSMRIMFMMYAGVFASVSLCVGLIQEKNFRLGSLGIGFIICAAIGRIFYRYISSYHDDIAQAIKNPLFPEKEITQSELIFSESMKSIVRIINISLFLFIIMCFLIILFDTVDLLMLTTTKIHLKGFC